MIPLSDEDEDAPPPRENCGWLCAIAVWLGSMALLYACYYVALR